MDRILKNFRLLKSYSSFISNKKECNFLPFKLWIETTSRCNLSCNLCVNKKLSSENKGDMKYSLFKKIIDEAKEFAGEVNLFHRGEPLLHPEIFDMIKYAKQNNLLTCIHTNATLLDKNTSKKIIMSGLDRLFFSFDSFVKKEYEKNRVGADFNLTLANIIDFLKIKKELNAKKPVTVIQLMEYSKIPKNTKNKSDFLKKFA